MINWGYSLWISAGDTTMAIVRIKNYLRLINEVIFLSVAQTEVYRSPLWIEHIGFLGVTSALYRYSKTFQTYFLPFTIYHLLFTIYYLLILVFFGGEYFSLFNNSLLVTFFQNNSLLSLVSKRNDVFLKKIYLIGQKMIGGVGGVARRG